MRDHQSFKSKSNKQEICPPHPAQSGDLCFSVSLWALAPTGIMLPLQYCLVTGVRTAKKRGKNPNKNREPFLTLSHVPSHFPFHRPEKGEFSGSCFCAHLYVLLGFELPSGQVILKGKN